jgi:DNA-binding transcriptional LysR family regulator
MLGNGQHLSDIQMNDRLQELTVFVRVGESGSFTRAARDMNLSQPSVSRIVGELEARLGVKLLLRTTRRLTLTTAG